MELIVVVSVIATIAVIGMVYGSGYKASTNNAERLSDVDTLKLAADSYFRAKGDYPEPTGNRVYFDSNGSYEHSATGAYGVSWIATSDLFGAEFLAEVPKDPETGNHYGYGKRKDGVAAYDFATVDRRADGYFAHVRGTYDGSALPSLVREYNGPNFVEDGKTEHLPYNPAENKITAKIASYSGAVSIAPAKSLTGELVEGDVINVPSGWFAVFHVSDGTEARIGSAASATELKLENLSVKDSKGFLTKVRFALNSGEIWTKAPKLREDRGERSELEITTGTAVASVRGTVFGVTKTPSGTDVTLVVGKLEISALSVPVEATWMTGGTVSVDEGGIPKKVSVPNSESADPVVTPAPEASSKNAPWNGGKNVNKAKLKKIKRSSGAYQITFNNEQGFTKVTVPVSTTTAGTADVRKSVSGTGVASVTFTASELAYLPNYVSGPNAVSANSEFVRLPLRFEGDVGPLAETEIVIPRWTADFEYDEESIPSWSGMECAAGYAWFESEGCQPKSLRAIAKFDSFVGQGNEFWDLYLYDRLGNRLPTIQNFLSAKDMSGKNYARAFWRSASSSYADSWAFRTAANGSKGIVMETSNRDDYLAYDVSRLDVNHQDFAITVGVLSSGLARTYSTIEKESYSPSLSDEKRAYLWSLPDGTALYYRAMENDDDVQRKALASLVLVDSTGRIRATADVPASVASLPLQNVSIETRFTTAKGIQNATISAYFEKSASATPYLTASASEVYVSKLTNVYLASTKPKIENGAEKFDFNWGGKKDCWNSSIEIVDSLKISSFD